ncbi:phosphonopyruvate decarboxylase [Pseudorhodoplanes sp.]|uniref:phosphonopyruvate decarboxylase n=1 Tax=Pseudorhodoplanes sp. TaxID=1934341 RepID=UPI002BE14CF9|nr:phosphonopyruvate decarboxylase [Pseudorhodoplanes sp.]HWV51489.1 phosphonopyruvate decarboxylase [Pseudorhodoplanes sp.]
MSAVSMVKTEGGWRDEVWSHFMREQIELFAYLPDGGLDFLIRRLYAETPDRAVMLTTEEEGVGVCSGAWLGGKRSVMAIQSSGVGNCINAFSLVTNCRFPLFLLVSMRGEFGEGNPWQIPMGSITGETLKLAGFHVFSATREDEAGALIAGGLTMAFRSEAPVAVLLSQRLLGAKVM